MSTRIGGVVIDVDARLSSIEKELQKATRELSRFEKSSIAQARNVETGLGKIGSGITTLGASLAGLGLAVGIGELAGFARSALAMGDDLATAADQAQIGVERFQTLRQAFRELEVDGDAFDKSMMRLVTTLGDVQSGATNEATKALDKMGITARVLSGEIDETDELLDAIAASSMRFGTEAEFTSAVVDVFGRRVGVQMAAALSDGGAALHAIEADVRSLGTVLTEEQINKLADANEVIDRFTESGAYNFAIFASKAIGSIQWLGDKIDWLNEKAHRANIATAQLLGIDAPAVSVRFVSERMRNPRNGSDVNDRLGFDITNRPTSKPARVSSGGGGGSVQRRSGGGGSGPREAETFSRTMADLARRTADTRMEFTALNEQWDDVTITDAKMRAEALRIEQEQGTKWTELQRGQYRAAAEDLRGLAVSSKLAEINQRAFNVALSDADLAEFSNLPALESDLTKIAGTLPDLRSGWDIAFAGLDEAQGVAFDGLTHNLEGALLGFQSLEDAVGNFAKQLASMALQALVFKPLGAALGIPGFAEGTNSAPGGLALVGERGPELVNLPRGSQVIPNNQLMNMASPLVTGIGSRGGDIITVNVTVPAGVDLATRTEVVRLAEATKRATLSALADQRRRAPR